jgi:hypothetical protein
LSELASLGPKLAGTVAELCPPRLNSMPWAQNSSELCPISAIVFPNKYPLMAPDGCFVKKLASLSYNGFLRVGIGFELSTQVLVFCAFG